jgi:hypothetical protein
MIEQQPVVRSERSRRCFAELSLRLRIVPVGAAVLAVALLVPAVLPATAAPRKPPPVTLLQGTGIVRLGTTFAAASGYNRYPYVVVSQHDAAAAAKLPGTTLVYMSGTSIPPTWFTGVPFDKARANGWLLKDAGGHYIVNDRYGTYIADVGNPAYQQAFVAGVSSFLARTKVDGVFLDDVVGNYDALTGAEVPAQYPSEATWEDAMASFVATVGSALKARGRYVLVNAGKFVAGDPKSDSAGYTTEFWRRIGPNVSGLMCEYWLQSPTDTGRIRVLGSLWYQNWDGWQSLVSVAQNTGADFFGLMFGSAGNAQAMRFGRGSFLLDWNGRGGAFMYSIKDRNDPYADPWVTQFGGPLRPKLERLPGVWQRRYSRGLVVVNATSAPVTLLVNGARQTIAGGDALFSRTPS